MCVTFYHRYSYSHYYIISLLYANNPACRCARARLRRSQYLERWFSFVYKTVLLWPAWSCVRARATVPVTGVCVTVLRCSLTAVVLAFTSGLVLRGPGVGERQRRAAGLTVRQQVKIHPQVLRTDTQTHGHASGLSSTGLEPLPEHIQHIARVPIIIILWRHNINNICCVFSHI